MVIGSGERQDKREEERPGEEEGRREGEKRSQGLAGGWREEGREWEGEGVSECLFEREGERERGKRRVRGRRGFWETRPSCMFPSTLSTRLLTLDPHDEQFCTMHGILIIDSKLRFPFRFSAFAIIDSLALDLSPGVLCYTNFFVEVGDLQTNTKRVSNPKPKTHTTLGSSS